MMPYSRINIGDVFESRSNIDMSRITHTVTDKADGLVEVESLCQRSDLCQPKKLWKKPSNTIFRKRILSKEDNSTTIESEKGYAMGYEEAEFEKGYTRGKLQAEKDYCNARARG
ncbi:hypothetical protein KA005_01845 [bacterium]|nr:hypothetical protein [bacterium]